MITSDEVLSDREQPASVLFVGGGVIALELGHVYARAGTKVTILEVLPRLLPALAEDAVEQIRQESERIGIDVHTGMPSSVAHTICTIAPGTAMDLTESRSSSEKCRPTPNINKMTPISASSLANVWLATKPGVAGPISTPAKR